MRTNMENNIIKNYKEFSSDEIFKIVFEVTEKNEWTDEREGLMVDLLHAMSDEEKIDLAEDFASQADFFYDNYDEAATQIKYDLIFGNDLDNWDEVLEKFGRLDD